MTHDLVFSYRHADAATVRPLIDALRDAGVRVWVDEDGIGEQESITGAIREAIATSKALLACYSRTYGDSRACQEELIAAYVAAHHLADVTRRVLIVNPESDREHLPLVWRDRQLAEWPLTPAEFAAAAVRIRERINGVVGELGRADAGAPPFMGTQRLQSPRFVGRAQELWDLHGLLTADRVSITTGMVAQPVAQVRGMGGNGKTMLAQEYAARFAHAYPGGVFWLDAYGDGGSNQKIGAEERSARRSAQLRQFAVQLGSETAGRSPDDLETALWAYLRKRQKPCLWIVDDVPSGLDHDTVRRDWIARSPDTSTLLTLRTTQYEGLGGSLDLPTLPTEDAMRLLLGRYRPDDAGEWRALEELAQELGNHPLALEIAATFLAKGVQRCSEFLADLRSTSDDALELSASLREHLPTRHERSIAGTLLKSIDQLDEHGLRFMQLASVVAAAPLPVDFVQAVFARLRWGSPHDVLQAIDQADTFSLCTRNADSSRVVHALVARTVRFRLFPPGQRTADPPPIATRLRTFTQALQQLTQRQRPRSVEGAAAEILIERLAAAAEGGWRFDSPHDISHARHLGGAATDPVGADLGAQVAGFDFDRGDYRGAVLLQQRVLEVRMQRFGASNVATVMAMANLALSAASHGDLVRARELGEQALPLARQLLGDLHADTLAVKHNLGLTLAWQGKFDDARTVLQEVYGARQQVLGAEHPDTLVSGNCLAETMREMGDAQKAVALRRTVLARQRALLSDDHVNIQTTLNNYALDLHALGDWQGARQVLEELLPAVERAKGKEHPDSMKVRANLAHLLMEEGDLRAARDIQEPLLADCRRVLGEDHPDTLVAMNNLARTIKALGDLARAVRLERELSSALERTLGGDHPHAITAQCNLADSLRSKGELTAAHDVLTAALSTAAARLGEEHPLTLRAAGDMAVTCFDMGDLDAAHSLQTLLLPVLERVSGDRHQQTITARHNLGRTLCERGDLAGARDLQERVLEALLQRGPDAPLTVTVREALARTLMLQGEIAAAEANIEDVLAARRRVLGQDHLDTIGAIKTLSDLLKAKGEIDRARSLHAEVLQGLERVLGPDHALTVNIRGQGF